jgi:hypothetical protein
VEAVLVHLDMERAVHSSILINKGYGSPLRQIFVGIEPVLVHLDVERAVHGLQLVNLCNRNREYSS